MKVSDLRGDPASGEIGGEKGAYFIINIGSVLSGTLVEVIHFEKFDHNVFMIPLFKTLAKYIPIEKGFRIYELETWYKGQLLDLPTYVCDKIGNYYYICKDLHQVEFDIEIVHDGGINQLRDSKKVYVDGKEERNGKIGLRFQGKENTEYKIGIKNIEIINLRSLAKKGIISEKSDLVIEVIFNDNLGIQRSIVLNVEDKWANILQRRLGALKDQAKGARNLLWPHELPPPIKTHVERTYGKIVLQDYHGEYYGGHKVHLAGGVFSTFESGAMYLTENYFIFRKTSKNPSEKWEIIIPLRSVLIKKWDVKEESRRQNIFGVAGSMGGEALIGGGVIHEAGQRHRLVIPYVDENGITHEPVFGVSSFKGKAIRKWTAKFYELLIKVRSESNAKSENDMREEITDEKETRESPLQILKRRLAKGEISKQQV